MKISADRHKGLMNMIRRRFPFTPDKNLVQWVEQRDWEKIEIYALMNRLRRDLEQRAMG